jgi:hypothetical protein
MLSLLLLYCCADGVQKGIVGCRDGRWGTCYVEFPLFVVMKKKEVIGASCGSYLIFLWLGKDISLNAAAQPCCFPSIPNLLLQIIVIAASSYQSKVNNVKAKVRKIQTQVQSSI